jgi:hypothetical protein
MFLGWLPYCCCKQPCSCLTLLTSLPWLAFLLLLVSLLLLASPLLLVLAILLLLVLFLASLHRKKRFTSFPTPAGMSLTKLSLGRNNSVMTSWFPPRESLVVTSRLGTENSRTFFYGVLHGAVICCSAVASVPADAEAPPDACIPAAVKRPVVLMLLSTLLLSILADAGSLHGIPILLLVSLQLLAFLLLLPSIPLQASLITLASLLLLASPPLRLWRPLLFCSCQRPCCWWPYLLLRGVPSANRCYLRRSWRSRHWWCSCCCWCSCCSCHSCCCSVLILASLLMLHVLCIHRFTLVIVLIIFPLSN